METISYREKPWNRAKHTPRHTNPHTPEHVDTEAAESQTPKIKTVRLAHPQQQRMKQFYIADRKQKKYWQDCQRLCQLKSTNNDPKYTSSHDVISVRKSNYTDELLKTGKCISTQKKSNKKKTLMMTRDYQSKTGQYDLKKKRSINIMENRQLKEKENPIYTFDKFMQQ